MSVCQLAHHFGPDWNISTTNRRMGTKFGTDIHGSQMTNDTDDPLTFPVAPL